MLRQEAEQKFKEVVRILQETGASMRCDDLARILRGLGFTVRDGKRGGHKVFSHSSIPEFLGSGYNCGHGKNPEIKRAYIRKVVDVLDSYEDQIKEYLEKAKP